MSNFQSEEEENGAMIRFVGSPNRPDLPREDTLWRRFLRAIWPWATKEGGLVDESKEIIAAYHKAEVAKKQSEAQKFAAEATDIAARAELKKQEKVKVVNDEIARIFSAKNLPEEAKQLQLANLMSNNPELANQLSKIEAMMYELRIVHGSRFGFSIKEEDKVISKNKEVPELDSNAVTTGFQGMSIELGGPVGKVIDLQRNKALDLNDESVKPLSNEDLEK